MRSILALLVCAIMSFENLQAQTAIANKFTYRSHTYSGTTLPYRLFVPDGYSGAKHYPLVLVLHSAGERGSDNNLQLTNTRMATNWADSIAQLKNPCFVVAPQCPLSGGWSAGDPTSAIRPEMATVIAILDSLNREFSIDTNRVYVTGFSMGGSATWEIIMRFPQRFAAAVPMAGGANPAYAYLFASVPVWDFHGTVDQLVPVMYSRVMMDSLKALGRTVVYTHCHNLDCAGLPDSTIAMEVGSHADLFYTEIKNTGHTYGIWGTPSNYPHLPTWMFDKHKKQPGAISLTSLKSFAMLSGNTTITWSSSTGDSVEIWFSPDGGTSWRIVATTPNTGSFAWNSSLVPDCAFGSVKLFLKTGGFIVGSDRSSYFSVNNTALGAPFVRLLNEEFTTGATFAQDSLDLGILAGDPTGGALAGSVLYSSDGGSTFGLVDTSTIATNPAPQSRRIGIGSLANSNQAVLRLSVDNGKLTSRATSYPFSKITPRLPGTSVARTAGSSGATITIHVVSPSALTGHRYQVRFDDTSSAQKQYLVKDVDLGTTLVDHATELDGVKEGPLFDGIRLVIADVTVPRVSADSTRWTKGSATLKPTIRVPSGGKGSFYDYRITLFSSVVDTSKGGFGPDPSPMKFLAWNISKNRKAAVVFYNANGDNAIGPDVRIDILEPDSTSTLVPAWSLLFPSVASVLPAAGDEFVLNTVKPLTSSDVFEFSGTVSSIPPGAVPTTFSLEQNFPNPFNPFTTIKYTVGGNGAWGVGDGDRTGTRGSGPALSGVEGLGTREIRLVVYDLLGRQVATLVNEVKAPGSYVVRFDGSRVATGVYFYRLSVGSSVQTRKMMLLK